MAIRVAISPLKVESPSPCPKRLFYYHVPQAFLMRNAMDTTGGYSAFHLSLLETKYKQIEAQCN